MNVVTAAEAPLVALLGLALGAGLCLAAAAVPRIGAPSLARRIAPHLRDIVDAPGGGDGAGGGRAFTVRSAVTAGFDRLGGVLGSRESVARRLTQAGREPDVGRFRARQLAGGLAGLGIGAVAALGLALGGGGSATLALLPPATAAIGIVGADVLLTRRARARAARLAEELPDVLEFLALCLAAGEGVFDALRRVAEVGGGELTTELRAVVLEVGTGTNLPDALTGLASRTRLPALGRAVDHVVAALDRGAPLARVLQDQATDAREDAKRGLIESAGRKEILMLLPLVFLLLPLSVLFAIFPGVQLLRGGIG